MYCMWWLCPGAIAARDGIELSTPPSGMRNNKVVFYQTQKFEHTRFSWVQCDQMKKSVIYKINVTTLESGGTEEV